MRGKGLMMMRFRLIHSETTTYQLMPAKSISQSTETIQTVMEQEQAVLSENECPVDYSDLKAIENDNYHLSLDVLKKEDEYSWIPSDRAEAQE